MEHDTGQFAVVSYCDGLAVSLWETRAEAEQMKAEIDRTACGGYCCHKHRIMDLNIQVTPEELSDFTLFQPEIDGRGCL